MIRIRTLGLAAALAVAAAGLAAAGPAPSPELQRQQTLFTAANPAPADRAQDVAAWESLVRTGPDLAMAGGDPHPVAARALAAAADARAERQHSRDIAQWDGFFSHAPYPNMGLGGHGG